MTDLARDLCSFVDASPTPYHAVLEVSRRLERAGFTRLDEREAWRLAPGDRRFLVRGGGTILAFRVGSKAPAEAGFRIVGAHTDSPNLRVKPNPDLARSGYEQVGVEPYGGVLLATWLDRDLSIAGEVTLRGSRGIETRLVDLRRPVARVPNLAIHLNRGVNKDGLVVNEQKHLPPVLGLGKEADLRGLVARELEVAAADVLGWDLCLYDVQPAALAGVRDELVLSARLDNLGSCHAATRALEAAAPAPAEATQVIALWDHEECGSRTAAGAAGTVLRDTLSRLVACAGNGAGDAGPEAMVRAIRRSFLVSADMAHAVHPNHDGQHDGQHAPAMGGGMVLKVNANQSYATSGRTAGVLESLAREAGKPLQRFVVRSDLPCGSTIGPIAAAGLGLPTVDVGAPMLSMHSCREMAGAADVETAVELYRRALAAGDVG